MRAMNNEEVSKEAYAYTPGLKVKRAMIVTKAGTKPVYVSVGHRISLKRATEIVLECTRKYRIPEPIRRAHQIANEEKKKHQSNL